ncbi:hypothetical protein G4V62_17495 [Bacillaceae bacterium SIJ1]|uniref:hypothetical protein n=1 Tax=Litoribacterium kuwaitense TaxID=1398745 RepID=UPI0013EDE060|nr:hypothetical protein [Litoribacterium kuwaitense]NGP46651.1 hypothetical protein [Litoribacterium kuwaitense]
MSRTNKVLFIIFNSVYFFFNWILIPYMPNPLIFGWMPLQMFLMFSTPLIAAFVWWLYYHHFFKAQTNVKYQQ